MNRFLCRSCDALWRSTRRSSKCWRCGRFGHRLVQSQEPSVTAIDWVTDLLKT